MKMAYEHKCSHCNTVVHIRLAEAYCTHCDKFIKADEITRQPKQVITKKNNYYYEKSGIFRSLSELPHNGRRV